MASDVLPRLLSAPYLAPSEIHLQQLERISHLLKIAGTIDIYGMQYRQSAKTIGCLEDLTKLPVVSKQDLLLAYPHGFPSIELTNPEATYKTYSSGSSGLTLPVHFSLHAVSVDTLMGVRQLAMQSVGSVGPTDLTANYYTVPWWTDKVTNKWKSAFISSLLPPYRAADILRQLQPTVFSGYASLISAATNFEMPTTLKLVIVNSEQSTRGERNRIAEKCGCPVLDEYSSEELARLAFEMPDGFYYVNEDCVYLEILDPTTREPVPDGHWGEAVITGLLNDVMPFIRYATGDLVRRPIKSKHGPLDRSGGIGWGRLDGIGGRSNDSFVRRDGTIVPAGSVLDTVYRVIAECDASLADYEVVQLTPDQVRLTLYPAHFASASEGNFLASAITEKLSQLMQERICLQVTVLERGARKPNAKRRPVRREFIDRREKKS